MTWRFLITAATALVLLFLQPRDGVAQCWKCPAPEDIIPCYETDGPGHTGGCGYYPICHGGSCTTYCAGMGNLCNLFGFVNPSGRLALDGDKVADAKSIVFDAGLGVYRRACDGAILSAAAAGPDRRQREAGAHLVVIELRRAPRWDVAIRS